MDEESLEMLFLYFLVIQINRRSHMFFSKKITLVKLTMQIFLFSILFLVINSSNSVQSQTNTINQQVKAKQKTTAKDSTGLIPLAIKLPKPMFVGTPQNLRVSNLEKPLGKPRPPFYAPSGTENVAIEKIIQSSDPEPIIGEVEMINDGDREATDGSFVEFGPFLQHITIDLEVVHDVFAILFWHYHKQPRVYFDIIVQVSNDPDFIADVITLYNNDHDNSSGMGIGKNKNYVETSEGRLVDAKGHQARYVRLYSNGSNANDMNHYIEVEVYGQPAK